eukprot:Selendium_serpulae@DN4272_c0_g1_i3.p1
MPTRTCRAISGPELCAVTRLLLLVVSVSVFSHVDVSRVYHFIRGQSLMKLYVVFNMLEIFERMWRSLGRDLIDSLMKEVLGFCRATSKVENETHRSSAAEPAGQRIASICLRFAGVFIYCNVHCFMHLIRALALNIAINSSESSMFLLVVTNNFGEIKSSVFKKHNSSSLFAIFASDVVEQFQMCCDTFVVMLRMSASNSFLQLTQATNFNWLMVVFVSEVIVDVVKHCFIVKFNLISASSFDHYKLSLVADVLLSRRPKGLSDEGSEGKDNALDVPCRFVYSFSHIPCRRLGFISIPLVILIFCCLPGCWTDPKTWLVGCLIWQALFLLKVVLSIFIVSYSVKRRGKLLNELQGTTLKHFNAL